MFKWYLKLCPLTPVHCPPPLKAYVIIQARIPDQDSLPSLTRLGEQWPPQQRFCSGPHWQVLGTENACLYIRAFQIHFDGSRCDNCRVSCNPTTWEVKAVQDQPLLLSEFQASLGYVGACQKTTKKVKSTEKHFILLSLGLRVTNMTLLDVFSGVYLPVSKDRPGPCLLLWCTNDE